MTLKMSLRKQFQFLLLALLFVGNLATAEVLAQSNQITQLSRVPSGVLISDYTLNEYKVSADGSYAVYRTQDSYYTFNHLMSVPTNGSRAPKQLNMPLPVGGMIKDFAISPDGKFVVYSANQRAAEQFELYTVEIGGGTPRLISVLPGNVGNVHSFQISPDSSHVVYRYEYYPDNESPVVSLFCSVPIRGGGQLSN